MVAGCLAATGHHTGRLAPGGLTAGLLTVERGVQLAGVGRAEVSAVDQVAGVEGATGESWLALVAPKGVGGEVSRAAIVGHLDGRYEFSRITLRIF